MTPDERTLLYNISERLERLEQVENPSFINLMFNRLFDRLKDKWSVSDLPDIKLSDLTDVGGTDSPSDGQVLKYDGTTDNRWEPGTDNIA